ncbi:neurotrypsin-like [Antedon mediterranea]|uniref:neurotrypsin-like n=1 Tax=Antedon mediterranea TaxID=105859 RepID=UPI003AF9CABB
MITSKYTCPGMDNNEVINLVGGNVKREGRLELKGDISGTVCSVGWTEADAALVCKSLGYEGVDEYLVYSFGEGNGTIWSNINGCIEHPTCNPTDSTEDPQCTHANDVGIVCSPLTIRLVGGDNLNEGRVEFNYFGEFSTIRDLHISEADVICRSLPFPSAEFSDCCGIYGTAFDLPSYQVECKGNEKELSDCSIYTTYDIDQQSGIRCSTDGVRLTGQFESDGPLEIFTSSAWHKVCSVDFNIEVGEVICSQLNFDGVLNVTDIDSDNGTTTIREINCTGMERKFEECSFNIVPEQMCTSFVKLSCIGTYNQDI